MIGAVLKLSYNKIGDNDLEGGICGTFFIIDEKIFLTADHVLNNNTFIPNHGYKICEIFLCVEPNVIIKIKKSDIENFPEIDTCKININSKLILSSFSTSIEKINDEASIYNTGFTGGNMPNIGELKWGKDGIDIGWVTFENSKVYGFGNVINKKITITSNDINLDGVDCFITSYPGIEGMSGGPLFDYNTNKVIGLMSFGLPADSQIKNNLAAVNIKEILQRISNKKIESKDSISAGGK